jgi:phenylacetate-coenzyme A ligase PaaK-like adenylate-forming protein
MSREFRKRIFSIKNTGGFNELALEVFRYQVAGNTLYRDYLSALGIAPASVKLLSDIPFLPVTFFKDHKVITGKKTPETIFESSGTTGISTGKHYVTDLSFYEESFIRGFTNFYGDPADYFFAALLPSYAERENSSLIYMMDTLIKKSIFPESGFYNNDQQKLIKILEKVKGEGRKAILFGVSFALLDLAEKPAPDLSGIIVVETGGMKGRRKEITRQELHAILKNRFNVSTIHSEYGMTELLSQAWSKEEGLYYCPPWMKVLIRDPQDPLTIIGQAGRTGGINIIDLANINSCSFLSVNDLGKLHEDGGFEVLGRFDNSDIRGCNLLVD